MIAKQNKNKRIFENRPKPKTEIYSPKFKIWEEIVKKLAKKEKQ